ncbi:MAG: hydroxylamine reductase, partial [Phycisphaerae bacterium]|nr:hydroxylamine reductase [Phycisphaerae bacterium]
NVNFDPERFADLISRAAELRDKAKGLYESACKKAGRDPETLSGPAAWQSAADIDGMLAQAADIGIEKRKSAFGDDV